MTDFEQGCTQASNAYVADTSSPIGLNPACPIKKRRDVWDGIEALASSGRITAPYGAYKEIDPRNADLHSWAKSHMEVFAVQGQEVAKLAQKIAANNRSLPSHDRSKPNADPYVIALAKLQQGRLAGRRQVIVTEERDKPGRIPDVARRYGIECINLEGMIREEGWA